MAKIYKLFLLGLMVLSVLTAVVACNKGKDKTNETSTSETDVTKETTEEATTEKKEDETEKTVVRVDNDCISFSHSSGVYDEGFELVMENSGEGKIYYTVDGSDPAISDTAVLYEKAVEIKDRTGAANVVSAVDPVLISGNFNSVNKSKNGFTCKIKAPSDSDVDKINVVRAVVKYDDESVSNELAATYFIGKGEDHIEGLSESVAAAGKNLAVISISVNYNDFFGSKRGIYVKGDVFDKALEEFINSGERLRDGETARSLDANYKQKGREWERIANVTMFEMSPDGATEVINQTCGIRIQGNYSRSDLQKGLRIYARSEYGDNNFRYTVFGEDYLNKAGEVMDKFKTLTLRAGGNCAFTAKINDTYWQSLVEETECATKKSRPCVVYLNGEYWGLYVLEEDYTDDYFEDVYGVEKDDVIIYKGDAESIKIGYKLDEGEVPEGESEKYYFNDLLEFFKTHKSLEKQEDYDEFVKLVDPESVMDYFAVETWINNKWDWPGKNWSMWRTINENPDNPYADCRFRFMIYDVEFGGVSGKSDAYTNTIKEDNYKPKGLLDMDTKNPAVLCFAYLMTNENFRNDFYDRLTGLSEGMLEKERALNKLEEFESIYSPLYDQFFERYPGTGSTDEAINGGYASIKCIKDFLKEREKYIQKMIDYCEKTLGA